MFMEDKISDVVFGGKGANLLTFWDPVQHFGNSQSSTGTKQTSTFNASAETFPWTRLKLCEMCIKLIHDKVGLC